MPSSEPLAAAFVALAAASAAMPPSSPGSGVAARMPAGLRDLVDRLLESPARDAIIVGIGVVIVLVALLLLRSALRMRPGGAGGRRRGPKVAPPLKRGERGRGSKRGQRASFPPPSQTPATTNTSREEGTSMRSPGTRSYVKVLQALREQSRNKAGLEVPKRLFDLANTLEQHAIGNAQDLKPFAGEAHQLLRFTVRVVPRPNSDGVALRFLEGDFLLGAADGPFRTESAQRFVEMTEGLQRELRDWLESLRAVLPTAEDLRPNDGGAIHDPFAIPTYDAVPDDASEAGGAGDGVVGANAGLDLSGLTPQARVRRASAPRDPFGQRASDWTGDPDRHSTTRANHSTFQDPLRWDVDKADADDPASRPDSIAEPLDYPPLDAPGLERIPPVPHDLPQRLAKAVEGIRAVRDELDVAPPDGLQALERFFKHETLDRTSLLERVDRFVFTPFDAASLATESQSDPYVAQALEWLASEQAHLVDDLRERFGMHVHHAQVGEPFEPTHHVAVDTEAIAERSRDRTVARAHDHGYRLELGRVRRFLLRPKVTIFVMDEEPERAPVARPGELRATARSDGVMEVPVDTAYPGERDFSLTVYAHWRVGADLRAWIEVDGVRADFAHAEVVEADDGRSTVHLDGCDVPNGIRRGDGHLVLEDRTSGRTARHPFEVIT